MGGMVWYGMAWYIYIYVSMCVYIYISNKDYTQVLLGDFTAQVCEDPYLAMQYIFWIDISKSLSM